jgi:hypothetical protein
MSGPNESPPNTSLGTGSAVVIVDTTMNLLSVSFNFADLTTGTTQAHIHCCTTLPETGTANVATAVPFFPGFPIGVTSGTYNMTFNMMMDSTWNPAFITSSGGTAAMAEATFLAGLADGETYLNVHTTTDPGGEIRGFLELAPEPGTWLLAGAALILLGMRRRR